MHQMGQNTDSDLDADTDGPSDPPSSRSDDTGTDGTDGTGDTSLDEAADPAPVEGDTEADGETPAEGDVSPTADEGGDADDDPDLDARLSSVIYQVSQALTVVGILGLIIFLVTGAWPSMVVVNGHSMEPHIHDGSLMVVTASHRFAPDDAPTNHNGVITHADGSNGTGNGYHSFGEAGEVIVFETPSGTRNVHRALIHVKNGENWADRVNSSVTAGDSCKEIRFCPAPHAGFITKGDNNPYTDQVYGVPPVTEQNMTGVARWRIPFAGKIRSLVPITVSLAPPTPVSHPLTVSAPVARVG